MNDVISERRQRLVDILVANDLGAAAFVPGPNFFYLTGLDFHLMERPTLLFVTASGDIQAIMPELERLKWSEQVPDAQTFYWQDAAGYDLAFEEATAALGDIRLGIEGGRMRAFEADALRLHMGQGGVVDASGEISGLRLSKSPEEIGTIKRAIAISETALCETLEQVSAGMTEREIAGLLKMRILANGADGFAFDPIVLAGGKSANPHGVPDNSPLRAGDPLLIDFGAQLGGYNADITRTVFCEHVGDEHAQIYDTVLVANQKGRAVAGPNLTAHDLDEAVTGVLSASAFADLIVHKTGHGLGLDVHEAPQIMSGNHHQLVSGALITIEPGLYRPGEIGVRIEDDVLIGASGSRSLTAYPRELTIIGR